MMNELKNPEYVQPSKDFKVQIFDSKNNLIAETEPGLKYKAKPGPVRCLLGNGQR